MVLSGVGGYFYFERKFTPPENYLSVSGVSEGIPITWVARGNNAYSAILLPVQLNGTDKTFYMQLDFGSPVTFFYRNALISIQKRIPDKISMDETLNQVALGFYIKSIRVSSDAFRMLGYGTEFDFENIDTPNIIGTIGTDLLEKRIIVLDFKNSLGSFYDEMQETDFTSFEFTKRKILLPAKIGDKKLKLMYDSGTSGYEWITSKDEWEKYRIQKGEIKTEKGNSWGNPLTVITSPASQSIQLGNTTLKLSEVTYIEGTSKIQNLLMKLSGMQGMIGNKLLLDHRIILDCRNEKFKVE